MNAAAEADEAGGDPDAVAMRADDEAKLAAELATDLSVLAGDSDAEGAVCVRAEEDEDEGDAAEADAEAGAADDDAGAAELAGAASPLLLSAIGTPTL